MSKDEIANPCNLRGEELLEFNIGTRVTDRFIPGSEGVVIAHENTVVSWWLLCPRVKVSWYKLSYLGIGQTEESDWIPSSHLRPLPTHNACVTGLAQEKEQP